MAAIDTLLERFRVLGREEKMQVLLRYARKLEPVPQRLLAPNRWHFNVPECQTPVEIFPEVRDGKLYFYADVNVRQSPTVAAFLSILFTVTNGHAPAATIAIPDSFVRDVMDGIGLAAREVGLSAMLARVQQHAAQAASTPK